MNKEQLMPEAIENPEWTQYRISEEVKNQEETKRIMEEMKIRMDYDETHSLRQLKSEAFRLAISLKPQPNYNPMGGQTPTKYSATDLIKDAELIFESLIKKSI